MPGDGGANEPAAGFEVGGEDVGEEWRGVGDMFEDLEERYYIELVGR